MARIVAAVAIVTIAVAAWLALRSSSNDGARSSDLTRVDAATSQASHAAAPMLERATPTTADKASPAEIYASERRDDSWAAATEAEIGRRFQAIRGAKLDATDCRATRCALTLSGTQAQISKTIADLESNRGLHGYAETIVLTTPEKRPDGTVVLVAIATFRR